MKNRTTKPGKPAEYFFKEGCYIEEWLNTDQHEDLSVARVRVAANTATRRHLLLGTIERYVILSGVGVVTVGSRSWRVSCSDVVIIAAGESQKIQNQDDTDLIFLAICTPRFRLENYQELI